MKKRTLFLVQSAIIAALYVALVMLLGFVGFGPVQFRVAEVLTILPYFTFSAVPGLFIGCLISNFLGSPFGIWDIVFGSLATLLAALCSYYCGKIKFGKFLAPLPPIIINAVVVGLIISVYTRDNAFLVAFALNAFSVGIGELVACYGLGLPLLLALEKYKEKIFKT